MMNKIPPSELAVMKVIWNSDIPLSSREVIDSLQSDKGWKRTTILTLLSRLADRKFLSVEKIKRYTYYTALIKRKEYMRFETKLFFDTIHENSLKSLITTLSDNNVVSKDDIDEIKKWIK